MACYDSSNRNKAAETRANNTAREVAYLAGAYYDCAKFVLNSGIDDLGVVNRQFENMLSTYIQAGKIKRESYSKFKRVLSNVGLGSLSGTKENFVNTIRSNINSYNTSGVLEKLQSDFYAMLDNSGIKIPKKAKVILFTEFGLGISTLLSDTEIAKMLISNARSLGINNVDWIGPKVVVRTDGDGCSSGGATYDDVYANMDKVK